MFIIVTTHSLQDRPTTSKFSSVFCPIINMSLKKNGYTAQLDCSLYKLLKKSSPNYWRISCTLAMWDPHDKIPSSLEENTFRNRRISSCTSFPLLIQRRPRPPLPIPNTHITQKSYRDLKRNQNKKSTERETQRIHSLLFFNGGGLLQHSESE